MSEQVKKSTRTRPAKPGMVRVVVSLTQEHHDYLEAQAKQESPVFPRAVNEYLSINLAKGFEFMKQQDVKQGQSQLAVLAGQVAGLKVSGSVGPIRETITFQNTKE